MKPNNDTDTSILLCKLLVDIFEYADGKPEHVADSIIESTAYDVIASFFGLDSWDVAIDDAKEMVEYLINLADEAKTLAEILDVYVGDDKGCISSNIDLLDAADTMLSDYTEGLN